MSKKTPYFGNLPFHFFEIALEFFDHVFFLMLMATAAQDQATARYANQSPNRVYNVSDVFNP